MDAFYIILGLACIYSTIHFFVLSFTKNWKEKNLYEKIVSIFAMTCLTLLLIGSAS